MGFENGNILYYYLYNVQGDVIAIVRASTGQVVAKYSYDAWGKCTVTNATGYTVVIAADAYALGEILFDLCAL